MGAGVAFENAFLVLKALDRAPETGEQRKALARALTRVGCGTRRFAVEEVLLMLRHLENSEVHKRTQKENQLAEMCEIDPDSLRQIRNVFNDFDTDGSGKVSAVSIHILFKSLNVAQEQKQRKRLIESMKELLQGENALTFVQFLILLRKLDESGEF